VRLRGGASGVVLSILALSTRVSAEPLPGVDVRTWMPSSDPHASLVVEPVASPGPFVWSTAAWLHYDNDSVVLRSAATGAVVSRPLENDVGLDITANLGLGSRSSIGVRLPMFLDASGSGGLPATDLTAGHVPRAGFGDVALLGKGTLVSNDGGGFGLAALGSVRFPTGVLTSFESDSAPVITARLLAALSLRMASATASLGYTLRTRHEEWPASGAGGVVFGDEIPWTIGLSVFPGKAGPLAALDRGARQTWEVALHGSLPAGPVGPFGLGDPGSAALSPALLALSDRIGLGHFRDGFVLAGVDVGLDRAIGVPSARVTLAVGWALSGHDRDNDGIEDDRDQCPDIAEDRDGFEDADGCPEVDNDDDGIIDTEDACPNVAGPPSPDPRKNGCPVSTDGS
jgi:OmpA-OmpF porin, OOP family